MALAAVVGLGTGPLAAAAGVARPEPTILSPPGGPGAPRQGLSTKQKVAILAGAAALYYLYNKHKNSQV